MDKNLEKQIDEILTRGVSEVINKENLKKRLLSEKNLRIKLGIDPTSPNIHLGRAVTLLKLRDLQKLGHQVMFIAGDFTGQIGDTSDKDSERPMLSEDLVKGNMKTYFDQAYKILDPEKTKVFLNSTWLSKLTLKDIGELSTWFSLAEFISRENIKKRLDEGKRISLRELLYPLMQGYDSIMLDADLEIGGTDQRFNLLAGRELQRYYLPNEKEREIIKNNIGENPHHRWGTPIGKEDSLYRKPQDILMMNLIEGLDGRKMSSSWGNTINLNDDPNTMFGKVMRMGDELIVKYFIHCTRVPMEEIKEKEKNMNIGKSFLDKVLIFFGIKKQELNPRDAKVELAYEITKIYHGEEKARQAREYFINTFSKKEIPSDVQAVPSPAPNISIIDYMIEAKLADSKSDARRKIEQGGVSIDGEKVESADLMLDSESDEGKIMKVGKKNFVRIVFKK